MLSSVLTRSSHAFRARRIVVSVLAVCVFIAAAPASSCSIASGYILGKVTWEQPTGSAPNAPDVRISQFDRGELEQGSRPCGFIAILEIELPDHDDDQLAGYYIRVIGVGPRGMYVPGSLLLPRDGENGNKVFMFSWPEIVYESKILPPLDFDFSIVAVSKQGMESNAKLLRVRHPK